MSVVIPHRITEIVSQSKDPKKTILDIVGDLSGVDISGDMVLLGIYIRPEKTAGGIYRPPENVQEDVFQGKVGLVLKLGPNAFRNADDGELYEQNFAVGEWGVFKVGEAWSISIKGYPCRMVRDVSLKLKIKDPTIVF